VSRVEDAVRRAIEADEELAIDRIGGVEAVLAEANALATSRWFGDVVGVLTVAGLAAGAGCEFIVDGLRRNADRNAFIHAVDALAACPPPDLRQVILALDDRTRDRASAPLLRVEAATGVMRFAIAQPKWQSFATASVQVLEDIDDAFAAPMVCRLAAIGWEQFHDDELLALLERKSHQAHAAGQAMYERGVLGISLALRRGQLADIARGLGEASHWLRRACEADEDPRDARVYLLLTEALMSILNTEPARKGITDELRAQATMRYLWANERQGSDWLFPPPEAELEWVPLVDHIARVSAEIGRPSWLDASAVLLDVVKLYSAERSVRPGLPGIERAIRPAIEAGFVRERGLVAHLDDWLRGPGRDSLNAGDARILRENIDAFIKRESEGNVGGMTSTGERLSPPN
jgi:hypothetical protein